MEYTTSIFEKDKKKIRLQKFIAIAVPIFGVTIYSTQGLLPIWVLIAILVLMMPLVFIVFRIKERGINQYGMLTDTLTITPDFLQIRDAKIPLNEINDLIIYVDTYAGKDRELSGKHYGGENEITFSHKGKKYTFNYYIANRDDYKLVEKIVAKIEEEYPPNLNH